MHEVLRGTVESIVYRNDKNDYTVAEISCDGELFTVVGIMPMVAEGELVTLSGSWTYHREFGRQFAFTSYERCLPTEIEGIIQYLSGRTIKGVGPVTALKIVNKFGMDTFDVIENHPEWLTDIPGITRKKAAAISESFREQADFRGVMVFFKDYMDTGDITKIYKRFGASAVGIVRDNPYILSGGKYGITFSKVDELAASLGFGEKRRERVLSGINYVLKYNADTNGHTCLPRGKLVLAVSELLKLDVARIDGLIHDFIEGDELASYKTGDEEFLMTPEVRSSETYIADRLASMSGEVALFSFSDVSGIISSVESDMGISYATLQREALFRAMNSGVTIITGGPGTGKTTVVKALLAIFKSFGLKTVLAAPTGRAAKRLSEATGAEAKTIHRMLEMERTEADEIRFNRNSRVPLDEGAVIIDEASMMDLSLTDALLHALKRGTRLVLIGDKDQLPSVGAGNILADLIASERVGLICLSEVFRQSGESLIVSNAHRINGGEPPILNVADNDFFFVRRENERDIPATVASLILERLPKAYGVDIKDKIQVITPSKKGYGGVDTLNVELQARLNPPAEFKKEKSAHGTVFRVGDRVMQVVNNYELEWEKNGLTGLGIFNGDTGVIESIDRTNELMNIWFDDRYVSYPFENLDELELSYAITVHKSQGSEYPVVIIPMYSCPPMLETRNLLYTAVTRAKKMVILVGRSDVPARMVSNNREIMRYTTLKDRLVNTL